MVVLEFRQVSKKFKQVVIAQEMNLQIRDGSFSVIFGAPGTGKSTLLRLITGLDQPDKGEIYLRGENMAKVSAADRNIGYVPQSFALYARLPELAVPPMTPLRRLTMRLSRITNDARLLPALLITPVLLFFIIWNVIPTLWMIGLSFYQYQITMPDNLNFLGIENYTDIIRDRAMWQGLSRTFVWVFFGVGVQTILGMVLGYLFWGSKDMPGRRLALTLLFTPMIVTPVAAGLFFRLIYEPTFGILNWFTQAVFGQELLLLQSPELAFWAVLFVDIWMWTPFMILITLAALASVPKAEMEAAEIDRLSWFDRIRFIILPHSKFVLMLGILLRTIDSFKTLDLVYLMAVPGTTTKLIAVLLREQAFEALNVGWSSALAIILLLTAIAFTSIYLYILNLNSKAKAKETSA